MAFKAFNLNLIRVCINCSSFFVRESGFCDFCFHKLENISSLSTNLIISSHQTDDVFIQSRSLYYWRPNENRPLSILINNLKGGKSENDWEYYAKIFVRKLSLKLEPNENIKLISVPNSQNLEDHSFLFAKYISQLLCVTTSNCLKKLNEANLSQKGLSKKDRLKIQFISYENFSRYEKENDRFILVDDVITTGATAKAAYIALGRPRKFEVWTLAIRPLADN
jgi:predicted amidophosphoribosyltransferase